MADPPDLWAKAYERLPGDVRKWLSSLDAAGAQPGQTDAQFIDGLIRQAQEKELELEKNQQEHSDKFMKLLASMPRLLFTGRIFEMVYSKRSMDLEQQQNDTQIGHESVEHLHHELVDLYTGLLSALQFCYLLFTKTKTMRKVAAILNSSKPGESLVQLEEQHKRVISSGDDCKNISSHRLDQKYQSLLEDHQTSLHS
ncbi:hypothetical protein COL154_012517 [Colletotrichum chrysophilum]|nr:hypothetical protein COL154_012517 [Colletotrichum chrysophilum]